MISKPKLLTLLIMVTLLVGCTEQEKEGNSMHADSMLVYILVGSIRPTRTGATIANALKRVMDKRPEIKTEIVFVGDYALPFYADMVSPAQRKDEITDPVLARWSKKIAQADGYILVAPEYNAGYPATLKNALDSLYKEWNNKPVALVGYSGGLSGGESMLKQLRQVTQALEMIPVALDVKIPQSWKAFDKQGDLINIQVIEQELNTVVDQLIAAFAELSHTF